MLASTSLRVGGPIRELSDRHCVIALFTIVPLMSSNISRLSKVGPSRQCWYLGVPLEILLTATRCHCSVKTVPFFFFLCDMGDVSYPVGAPTQFGFQGLPHSVMAPLLTWLESIRLKIGLRYSICKCSVPILVSAYRILFLKSLLWRLKKINKYWS